MKRTLALIIGVVVMMISSCVTTSDTAELGGTVLYIARIDPRPTFQKFLG